MKQLNSKTFYTFTYGCQMNKSDSEILSNILTDNGYNETDNPQSSDILIFNTCAVRGNAENRALARMKEFNSLRKKNKTNQVIVITGCIPQYEKEEILKKYPFLDIVIGANSYEYLPELLNANNKSIKINDNKNLKSQPTTMSLPQNRDQAYIPIMYGCNNYCSYCIVPYTRGRELSRNKEHIFQEIEGLVNNKIFKILLLGQNVNSYGQGLYDDYFFADLIEDILKKFPNLHQLDFLTSHPKDINDKLINTIANNSQIGREIHFPLQHGDNRILELMNRKYTLENYLEKVDKLRDTVKNVKISTDLIVGFPSETEEEFQNTVNAVKQIGFYRINTASFSPRKGTIASSMPNQIDNETKKRRLNELNKAVKEYGFC
jgi:tRNA-2-methylthio-N6-dimethylallyladenosine synthase